MNSVIQVKFSLKDFPALSFFQWQFMVPAEEYDRQAMGWNSDRKLSTGFCEHPSVGWYQEVTHQQKKNNFHMKILIFGVCMNSCWCLTYLLLQILEFRGAEEPWTLQTTEKQSDTKVTVN